MNSSLRAVAAHGLMFLPAAACGLRGLMTADIPTLVMAQALGVICAMLCAALVVGQLRLNLVATAAPTQIIAFALCLLNLPIFTTLLGYAITHKDTVIYRSGTVGFLFSATVLTLLCAAMVYTMVQVLRTSLHTR